MVWQPGQSGNPTGEGRKGKAEKLAELASIYSRSAINTIAGIMENPEAKHADRLTAARMLLDRAVGTPVQAVNVSSDITISLVELLAGLPGQAARPAVIEHEAPPPPLVAGISLQEATEAAAELAGQEEDGELILRPANDDLGSTQPGGE